MQWVFSLIHGSTKDSTVTLNSTEAKQFKQLCTKYKYTCYFLSIYQLLFLFGFDSDKNSTETFD